MKLNILLIVILISSWGLSGCGGGGSFLMEQGKIDKNDRRYESAISNFEAELEQNPAQAEAWYWKGFCHEKLEQWQEMYDSYQKSIELSDKFKDKIDFSLTNQYVTFFNKSIACLEDTVKSASQKDQEALVNLNIALIISPDDYRPYKQIGLINKRLGNRDLAITYAKKAIERVPGDKIVKKLELIAFILERYIDVNDTSRIIEWSQKLINTVEIESASLEIIEDFYLYGVDNLADAYTKSGMRDEAEQVFAVALKAFPENEALRLNLAAMMVQRKDYDGAMEVFEQILAANPDNLLAHLQTGLMLKIKAEKISEDEVAKKAKFMEAIKHLEEVLRLEPDNLAATQSLPSLYFGVGDQMKGNEMTLRYRELKKAQGR